MEIKLTYENVESLVGSFSLGCSGISTKYKVPNGKMKLVANLGYVPDNMTEDEINKYLEKFTITVPS